MKKALAMALSIAFFGGSMLTSSYGGFTACAETPENTVPGKTSIYAFSNKDKSISVRFRQAENAEGYNIYRYSYNSGKWSRVGSVKSGDELKFTDENLTSGSAYAYKIKPYKISDNEIIENEECQKFSAVTKPRTVKVRAKVSGRTLKIKWSKTKCSGYRIYSFRGGKWRLSAKVSKNKTSFTYKYLPKKRYSFRVVPVKRTSAGKVYKSSDNATLRADLSRKTAKVIRHSTSTASRSRGEVMYLNKGTPVINIKNNSWGYSDKILEKGDKVIAYETRNLPGDSIKMRRIKCKNISGYVFDSALSRKKIVVKKLTQSDMDKLVKELQAYADEKALPYIETGYAECGYSSAEEMMNYDTEDTLKHLYDKPYVTGDGIVCPGGSWSPTDNVYTTDTYSSAKKMLMKVIDYEYSSLNHGTHIVVYARWCPKGKNNTNIYETHDCWEIFCLR